MHSCSSRVQLNRNVSPETVFTEITQQQSVSKHHQEGTFVTERPQTQICAEEEERDEHSPIQVDYPEPLPPVKPEDESQEEGDEEQQPGKLHPEFDLPYIFKVCEHVFTNVNVCLICDSLAMRVCMLTLSSSPSSL